MMRIIGFAQILGGVICAVPNIYVKFVYLDRDLCPEQGCRAVYSLFIRQKRVLFSMLPSNTQTFFECSRSWRQKELKVEQAWIDILLECSVKTFVAWLPLPCSGYKDISDMGVHLEPLYWLSMSRLGGVAAGVALF